MKQESIPPVSVISSAETSPQRSLVGASRFVSDRNILQMDRKNKRSVLQPIESELIAITNSIKQNPQSGLAELLIEDEKLFSMVLLLMKKPVRNMYEIQIIRLYLNSLPNFIYVLKKSTNSDDFNEILTRVTYHITYDYLLRDRILFRFGEKGDKFYIILSGKVAVLVPKEIKWRMNQQDYIRHLIKLRKCGETEILQKTLHINRHVYPVSEDEFEELYQNLLNLEEEEKLAALEEINEKMKNSEKNGKNGKNEKSEKLNSRLPSKVDLREIMTSPPKKAISPGEEGGLSPGNNANPNKKRLSRQLTRKNSSDLKPLVEFKEKFSVFTPGQDERIHVSIEDYISLTKPENTNSSNIEGGKRLQEFYNLNFSFLTHEVICWEYHHLITFNTGDTFGEVALQVASQKRTATILTSEDTYLGYITKDIYDDCIREANERTRRNNISFILTSRIFCGINKQFFEKKQIFSLFVKMVVKQGDYLFKENQPGDNLFLIKDGEYIISMNKSLFEINSLIKNLGGQVDETSDKKLFSNNDLEYRNVFSKKHQMRISIIKDRDIIGLSDFVFLNKYSCSVQCTSNRGEVFKLENQFYNSLLAADEVLLDNYEKYMKVKRKIFLKKLENIKNMKILSVKNFNFNGRNMINSQQDISRMNKIKDKNTIESMKILKFKKISPDALKLLEHEREEENEKENKFRLLFSLNHNFNNIRSNNIHPTKHSNSTEKNSYRDRKQFSTSIHKDGMKLTKEINSSINSSIDDTHPHHLQENSRSRDSYLINNNSQDFNTHQSIFTPKNKQVEIKSINQFLQTKSNYSISGGSYSKFSKNVKKSYYSHQLKNKKLIAKSLRALDTEVETNLNTEVFNYLPTTSTTRSEYSKQKPQTTKNKTLQKNYSHFNVSNYSLSNFMVPNSPNSVLSNILDKMTPNNKNIPNMKKSNHEKKTINVIDNLIMDKKESNKNLRIDITSTDFFQSTDNFYANTKSSANEKEKEKPNLIEEGKILMSNRAKFIYSGNVLNPKKISDFHDRTTTNIAELTSNSFGDYDYPSSDGLPIMRTKYYKKAPSKFQRAKNKLNSAHK